MQQAGSICAEVNQCMSGDRSNQCMEVFIAYLYLNLQNIPERIRARSTVRAHDGTGIQVKEHRGSATGGKLREREE